MLAITIKMLFFLYVFIYISILKFRLAINILMFFFLLKSQLGVTVRMLVFVYLFLNIIFITCIRMMCLFILNCLWF